MAPVRRPCSPKQPAAVRETACPSTQPKPEASNLEAATNAADVAVHQYENNENCEKYESRDPVTGRLWGMPSCFGNGQCRDCPKKAKAPSIRCIDCQRRRAKADHGSMSPDDMQTLRLGLDSLLVQAPDHVREQAAQRLSVLFEGLKAGRIERPVQELLLALGDALSGKDNARADRVCAELVKGYWREQKGWLKDLRHLLSLR